VPEEEVAAAQEAVRRRVRDEAPAVTASIRAGEELTAEARTRLLEIARAEIQRRTAEAS
jgi:hypothetical protein